MIRRTRYRRRVLRIAGIVVLGGWVALALTVSHGTGHGPAQAFRALARTSAPDTTAPQVPRVNLAGLRWTNYHGVELPSSPTAGPRHTAGGLAYGFADTPLGALLAALNIGVRANARQAATEEAAGAGVCLVSMYVTVTVLNEAERPRAIAETEAAAESSLIRLRRMTYSQAAGFAATLPCGICPG